MTIPQRILLHVGLGAGAIIAIATAVTYRIVYEGATQRELRHLNTYVSERARREEIGFKQVESNLSLVRGQFLKRMEAPLPRDYSTKWEERFRHYSDGAWRSREEFSDGRKFATLWTHKNFQLGAERQAQILRAQDICNELLPGWVDNFPSVYFVFPGWANIGFDPRIPSWVWDTPGDYDATRLEWFQLALPKSPLPNRISWTSVIEEPTSKNPIVSAYLPIVRNGEFVGSIGHDLFLNRLMEEATHSDLPGAMHVIFRADGRLIAHPTKRKEILATLGKLSMQNCGDPTLASLYRSVLQRRERQFSDYDLASGSYYSVAKLSGPDWFFLTTMPREILKRQAFQSTQWVLWSGLFSLCLLLGFLATTLRRQIAQPLTELTRATREMTSADISAHANVPRNDEFGALARSFNEMAERVRSRDADLRQLNQELEARVSLRTSELIDANRRLADAREEALRLLARERELGELKSEFVSLVSHEFRNPLEIIMSSVDNLQRYQERLLPEKREQLLRSINKSVRRMSDMMEEVLVLGRLETNRMTFKPAPIDLRALLQRLCDEIESATACRCPVRLHLNGTPDNAHADESLLRHILVNLLSNAVKYSPPGEPVDLAVAHDTSQLICTIKDHGCGIPETDQKRLFQAFHRGSNVLQTPGTGLGLLIVKRCIELHGGEIAFTSAEGEGTTFTVKLPIFLASPTPTRTHTLTPTQEL